MTINHFQYLIRDDKIEFFINNKQYLWYGHINYKKKLLDIYIPDISDEHSHLFDLLQYIRENIGEFIEVKKSHYFFKLYLELLLDLI